MLQKVSIQNFKSLKDVTLELQKVNLLIGPNNSGKSNFLRALDFKHSILSKNNGTLIRPFQHLIFQKKYGNVLTIQYFFQDEFKKSKIKISGISDGVRTYYGEIINDNLTSFDNIEEIENDLAHYYNNIKIYQPNPTKFITPLPLASNFELDGDCTNLITFLYTLSTTNKREFKKLEENFAQCVHELVEISIPPMNTDEDTKLSLAFFDKEGDRFSADEVSEGVLYFLALLCIVHQPNPPKLLLLEEPEKGIHPRRIKEVLNFIFQLAEDKDIQVIMTTHSERVLDEFEDIPEAVFIFDKDEEGATQVKNLLKDVIEPSDKLMEENNVPKIKFTDSLGSHWVTGFIGGVPR
jgi:predicted ATPase